jgi:hypothetical protein
MKFETEQFREDLVKEVKFHESEIKGMIKSTEHIKVEVTSYGKAMKLEPNGKVIGMGIEYMKFDVYIEKELKQRIISMHSSCGCFL